MGLSSQLAPSAIAKPGVCTSTTRPASPYEGQVIYETDTDKTLVWNSSAWVYLSTSTANPPGLELVSSGTFTNATTVDITGFTSTYKLFRVIYEAYRHSGTGLSDITATFRDASSAMTAVYYGCAFYMNYVAGTGAIKARNAGSDVYVGDVYTGTGASPTRCYFDVGGMNQTTLRPNLTGSFWSYGQTANVVFGGENNASNISPDRMRLSCAVGMTGVWRLYGYKEP